MTKQEVIDFLAHDFALSNLPDSFMQLQRISNDQHSDLDDVVGVARKDPELAASLLKLANSSVYSSGEQVGTLEEAAQLLGLRAVVQNSLALGIIKQIEILEGSFDLNSFWRRSLSVAVIAEAVHERAPGFLRSIVDSRLLYTSGLLHDIGMLAMIQGFTDEMTALLDRAVAEETPIFELEQQEFGFNHQDVGRILFKKWGLPEAQQCVAGFHHNPLALKRRLYFPLVDLVYVADYICARGDEDTPAALKTPYLERVWSRSRLSEKIVDDLVDRVPQVFSSADALLSS